MHPFLVKLSHAALTGIIVDEVLPNVNTRSSQ
jgi:hypothetical protein